MTVHASCALNRIKFGLFSVDWGADSLIPNFLSFEELSGASSRTPTKKFEFNAMEKKVTTYFFPTPSSTVFSKTGSYKRQKE